MIYELSLPQPSDYLLELVLTAVKNVKIDVSTLNWHRSLQSQETNCAAGNFFTDTNVSKQTEVEFQKFFTRKFHAVVGVLTNTEQDKFACYPPHSDRGRHVTINYYGELGGPDVATVFYNKYDDPGDLVGGNVVKYGQLEPVNTVVFDKNRWYAFNTKQFHSVEKIYTVRWMLSLSFKFIDFEQFKNIMNQKDCYNIPYTIL